MGGKGREGSNKLQESDEQIFIYMDGIVIIRNKRAYPHERFLLCVCRCVCSRAPCAQCAESGWTRPIQKREGGKHSCAQCIHPEQRSGWNSKYTKMEKNKRRRAKEEATDRPTTQPANFSFIAKLRAEMETKSFI